MSEPRYRPVKRLAAGGMAEVFIAEATSVQGFKKKVAIKRVLPHLAQNKNFIGMFLDEARLGAMISHANCTSVFDIGAADNTYFIVMEFVEGCDLKTIIDYYKLRSMPVPFREAIFMAIEACRGLHYAHGLADEDGTPLHIVHRDISPPNILLSRNGEVKVTDFGLAKASTQLEKTDPGVVKGKFAYLAPEAVNGLEVDARADVFAMGTVLWEMLTGQRLFLGQNDYETVKMVQEAAVPPLVGTVREADAEFDAILKRALTRDPAERFASAKDFGEALTGYLFKKGLKVSGYDIAAVVRSAVAEAEASRPKRSATEELIDQMIQEEMLRFTSIDHRNDTRLTKAVAHVEEGAQPLDVGDFVDPSTWLDDAGGSPFTLSESGWKEAGILDSSDSIPSIEALASNPSVAARPDDSQAIATEAGAKSRGLDGRTVAVVLAVAAVVGAAAAVALR